MPIEFKSVLPIDSASMNISVQILENMLSIYFNRFFANGIKALKATDNSNKVKTKIIKMCSTLRENACSRLRCALN